jgi:hypothetical protein
VFPLIVQSVYSSLIGAGSVDILLGYLRHSLSFDRLLILIFSSGIFIFITGTYGAFCGRNKSVALSIVGIWFFVTTIHVVGSLGNPDGLFSGWGGGRYFFLGAFSFVLLLSLSIQNTAYKLRHWSLLLLMICALSAFLEAINGEWQKWLIEGEPWAIQVEKCNHQRPCAVYVWPGPDWAFDLTVK